MLEKPTAAEWGLGCRDQDGLGVLVAAWEIPVPKPLGRLLQLMWGIRILIYSYKFLSAPLCLLQVFPWYVL